MGAKLNPAGAARMSLVRKGFNPTIILTSTR